MENTITSLENLKKKNKNIDLDQATNFDRIVDSLKVFTVSIKNEVAKTVEKFKLNVSLQQINEDISKVLEKDIETAENEITNVVEKIKGEGVSESTLSELERATKDATRVAMQGVDKAKYFLRDFEYKYKGFFDGLLNSISFQ